MVPLILNGPSCLYGSLLDSINLFYHFSMYFFLFNVVKAKGAPKWSSWFYKARSSPSVRTDPYRHLVICAIMFDLFH